MGQPVPSVGGTGGGVRWHVVATAQRSHDVLGVHEDVGEGEGADHAVLGAQTAGFLVDQLERAAYVERVADPTDARARLVRIASRGHQAAAVAREMERELDAEWTRHLGEERMRTLSEILVELREITDPYR